MFIFAADLHLSMITWQKLPELNHESLGSFDELLYKAHALDPGFNKDKRDCPLVLGGDVFDSVKMTPELLRWAIRIRDEYPDVPIFYINGNHDSIEPSWCSFFKNSYRLGEQPVTLPDGEVICGIDFQLPEAFPEAVSKVYPGCDYLVIHQTLDKLANNLPGSVDSTPLKNFNCVLAGDYHKNVHVDNLYSPGSTNRRSIAEDAGTALFVNNGEIQTIPLISRPLIQVPVDEPDIKSVISRLYNDDQVPEGIIVVRGDATPEDKDRWTTEVNDMAYLLFVPKVTASDELDIDMSDSQVAAVRGSKVYMLEMLEKYSCSDSAKGVIRDYLAQPDLYMEQLRGQLS